MAVKKVGTGYRVVKKDGTLGKRSYTTSANAQKAQSRGRALSKGSSPTGKSPKSSMTASSPAGGAKVGYTAKMGLLWKQLRTSLNLFAAALSPFSRGEATPFEHKVRTVLQNFTGLLQTGIDGPWIWHHGPMTPTYQGIGISLINDWWDRKTRNAGKISRGKIIPIIAELIPALRAHSDAKDTGDYMWTFADSYNKYTTGYSMKTHSWDFSRAELYAGAKAASWVIDKVLPTSWRRTVNSAFPKGINPL